MLDIKDPKAIQRCMELSTPEELLKYTADLQVAKVLLHEVSWLIKYKHLPFIRWGMKNGESVDLPRRWLISGLMHNACFYNDDKHLAVVKMLVEEYSVDPSGRLESGQAYYNASCRFDGPVTDYLVEAIKQKNATTNQKKLTN